MKIKFSKMLVAYFDEEYMSYSMVARYPITCLRYLRHYIINYKAYFTSEEYIFINELLSNNITKISDCGNLILAFSIIDSKLESNEKENRKT